ALRVPHLVVGAEVLDELVGMEDIAADLAPEAGRDDGSPLLRQLLLAFLLEPLGEARTEDLHGRVLVRRLRALVLALDDDPRRDMRDPDGRIRLVDVLAAGARGPVGVDPQVVVLDVQLDVVGEERRDDHLREARVAAASPASYSPVKSAPSCSRSSSARSGRIEASSSPARSPSIASSSVASS